MFSTNLTSTNTTYTITAQSPLNIAVGGNRLTLAPSDFTITGLIASDVIILDGANYHVDNDAVVVESGYAGNLNVYVRATDGTNRTALYLATINVGGAPVDSESAVVAPVSASDDDNTVSSDNNGQSDFTVLVNSTVNTFSIDSVYSGDDIDSVTINSATHNVAGGIPETSRISISADGRAVFNRPTSDALLTETLSLTLSNTQVVSFVVKTLPEMGEILGAVAITIDEDTAHAFELDDFIATIAATEIIIEPNNNYTVVDNIVTPVANFTGLLDVSVRLSDGASFTELYTIQNFVVTNVNDAPVLNPDTAVVYQNSVNNIIDILDNDFDFDFDVDIADSLTITQAVTDNNGSVVITNNQLVYTPNPSFFGETVISYAVSDGQATIIAEIRFEVLPVIFQRNLNTLINTPFVLSMSDFALNFSISSLEILSGENYTTTGLSIIPAEDFIGNLNVRIRLNGSLNGSPTSTIYHARLSVGTLNNNTPPTVVNDVFSVNQNSANNLLYVLNNDSDTDVADVLTITQASTAGSGAVSFTNDVLSFTPANSFTGSEILTYSVSDGIATAQGSVSVSVTEVIIQQPLQFDGEGGYAFSSNDFALPFAINTITVLPGDDYTVVGNEVLVASSYQGALKVLLRITGTNDTTDYVATIMVDNGNDTPVAVDDTLTVLEDSTAVDIDVLDNDIDLDGDTLAIDSVNADQGGEVSIVNGVISYTPVADFAGVEIITYTITDPDSASATGRVLVTVTNINDAPIANADTLRANINMQNIVIDVLDNDVDADNEGLSITQVSTNGSGQVRIVNNAIVYTPLEVFTGEEVITYIVSDGILTATTTLTVNVEPVIFERNLNTPINTPFVLSVSDFALNFLISSLEILSGENYTTTGLSIIPAEDFIGNLNVRIRLNGSLNGNPTSTIYQALLSVGTLNNNTPPTVVNDVFSVNQNSANNLLYVLNNDSDTDVGDVLTITQASSAGSGAVSFTNDILSFTPANSFTGTETLTYSVSDGIATVQGSVSITVSEVIIQQPLEFDGVGGYGFSINDFALPFAINTIMVLPGDDYTVVDNEVLIAPSYQGALKVLLRITGTNDTTDYVATIMVDNGNDTPVAVDDTLTMLEDSTAVDIDVLDNDVDLDGDTLTIDSVNADQGGQVSIVNGVISYTPAADFAGVEIITYTITDPDTASDTGRVLVTVTNVNDAPIANADTLRANINMQNIVIDVLGNDVDVDNEELSITQVSTDGSGQVRIVNNAIVYTPFRDFIGEEVITYIVSDGILTATTTLTVNVENSTILNNGNSVNSQASSLSFLWILSLLGLTIFRRAGYLHNS